LLIAEANISRKEPARALTQIISHHGSGIWLWLYGNNIKISFLYQVKDPKLHGGSACIRQASAFHTDHFKQEHIIEKVFKIFFAVSPGTYWIHRSLFNGCILSFPDYSE
jgi:hypothetical protein